MAGVPFPLLFPLRSAVGSGVRKTELGMIVLRFKHSVCMCVLLRGAENKAGND